jgi:hypothetical protein
MPAMDNEEHRRRLIARVEAQHPVGPGLCEGTIAARNPVENFLN